MPSITSSEAILALAQSLRADPAQFTLTVSSVGLRLDGGSRLRIDGPSNNTGGTNTTLRIDSSSSATTELSKSDPGAEVTRAVEEWARGLEAIAAEASVPAPARARIREMLDELVVKKLPAVVADATMLMLGGIIAT